MLRLFQPDENQIKKRATRHEIIVDHSTEIEREKQYRIYIFFLLNYMISMYVPAGGLHHL
jgi:hypothetical protein